MNVSLISLVQSLGGWALANPQADQAHYFVGNDKVRNTVISLCWKRVAQADNLTPSGDKPECQACKLVHSISGRW